jgi:hypothetical protein
MRAPPKRTTRGATIETHSIASRNKTEKVGERYEHRNLLHDLPDGPATVEVGYEIKRWESDRVGGITLGTTCKVTISCARDEEVVVQANDLAADLAYHNLLRSNKAMQDQINEEAQKRGR